MTCRSGSSAGNTRRSGKITYGYDFGAGWIHEIALQKSGTGARRRLSVLRQVRRRLTGGVPGL